MIPARDRHAVRVALLDNEDSFTFIIVDYLKSLGATVDIFRSRAASIGDVLEDDGRLIVISPGPGAPEDAGISVPLAAVCIEKKRPLLGVCLGHQAIARACGSTVQRVAPVHGKARPVRHDGSGVFTGLPSPLTMTRYHSLAVPDPSPPLIANAWSEDGLVMGLRHLAAPVHGVQFHPESVASEHGHRLLGNFLQMSARAAA